MPNRFTPAELIALPQILSAPRFARYAAARAGTLQALSLYHWNAQISSAFIFPLHFYEICIRNAAANAIEGYYGANWPWATAFEQSLPNPPRPNFSPRRELISIRGRYATTGSIIAELKFAFWQSIYTSRHDGRVWAGRILTQFPNFPAGTTEVAARRAVYDATDSIRALRNRIAHHEPIFPRDLVNDYETLSNIIGCRCAHTQEWMNRSQGVSNLLALKP